MSAKFIAQIEISKPCVSSASSPAEATQAEDRQHQRQPGGDERAEGEHEDRQRHRPGEELRLHHRRAVGGVEVRPHAGRAGQADRDAGVSRARAACPSACRRRRPSRSGRLARRRRRAPCGRRARSSARAAAARRRRCAGRRAGSRSTCATVARNAGDVRPSASASGRRPSAPSWRGRRSSAGSASRACTDSEPFACQPAPESAVSTFGANTASAIASTAQQSATARTWSAAQPPSRPIGPTASGCSIGAGDSVGRFGNCHSMAPPRSGCAQHYTQLYN